MLWVVRVCDYLSEDAIRVYMYSAMGTSVNKGLESQIQILRKKSDSIHKFKAFPRKLFQSRIQTQSLWIRIVMGLHPPKKESNHK